ncbi:MAG: YbbR-like domain-containing protein [Prevotella sp.]|nr:YbbR-like domain-containing protein [Prevotella sp.]
MRGKEVLVFLFFLALAGIFWLLTTLNESFEQEIRVPVRFTNVPTDVTLTSGDADTLRFNVRDKGISLVTYLYSSASQPLVIDFKRYAQPNGTGTVPAADLLRLLARRLPASATPLSVKPEQEVFYYNYGERKKVPVSYQGQVEPDPLYFISEVKYSTDSVTVFASREKLDSITRVYTEPLHCVGFSEPLTVNANIQRITGVKVMPPAVTIKFVTDVLTEVSIDDVPVVGINMPQGKVLRTFPAKLKVSFVTGIRNYQSISASDFLIVADYDELSTDSSSQCNVYLRGQPSGLQRVHLDVDRVDYLIEERP